MKTIPDLEFYSRPCPRRPRGWNVVPRIREGACTRAVFPDWTRQDHREAAVYHADRRNETERAWHKAIDRAVRKYGDQGPLISGGLREHWPRQTKNVVRRLARTTTAYSDAAAMHWKAGGYRRLYREAWISRNR